MNNISKVVKAAESDKLTIPVVPPIIQSLPFIGDSSAAIEAFFDSEAAREAKSVSEVYGNPEFLDLPWNAKWLLVSSLQKAIRRGHGALARLYAATLWRIDKNYLKFRLNVIAIEDVGAGDSYQVARWLAGSRTVKSLNAAGGLAFVLSVVQSFADSPKCRCADDTNVILHYDPSRGVRGQAVDGVGWWDDDPVIATSMIKSHHAQALQTDGLADFRVQFGDALRAKGVHPISVYIAVRGSVVCRETQWQSYPFWSVKADGSVSGVRNKPDMPINLAGPFLSASVDNHTREGKRALSLWGSRTGLLDMQADLPALLFRVEGHVVNNRIVYPGSIELAVETQNLVYDAAGTEIVQMFKAKLPELYSIRSSLMGGYG